MGKLNWWILQKKFSMVSHTIWPIWRHSYRLVLVHLFSIQNQGIYSFAYHPSLLTYPVDMQNEHQKKNHIKKYWSIAVHRMEPPSFISNRNRNSYLCFWRIFWSIIIFLQLHVVFVDVNVVNFLARSRQSHGMHFSIWSLELHSCLTFVFVHCIFQRCRMTRMNLFLEKETFDNVRKR